MPTKYDANDPVNHPAHYTDGSIEVIDFIEDKKLGYCLGNAIKYIARAGKKDPSKEIEDLQKARWYVDRRIKELIKAAAAPEADSSSGAQTITFTVKDPITGNDIPF